MNAVKFQRPMLLGLGVVSCMTFDFSRTCARNSSMSLSFHLSMLGHGWGYRVQAMKYLKPDKKRQKWSFLSIKISVSTRFYLINFLTNHVLVGYFSVTHGVKWRNPLFGDALRAGGR